MKRLIASFLRDLADKVEVGECCSEDWDAVAEIITRVEHKDGMDDMKSAIGYLAKKVESLSKNGR